jgi:hypothetical protein
MSSQTTFCFFCITILATFIGAHAYIPALPTNNTAQAIQDGLNVSDVSKLHLQWYSNGSAFHVVACRITCC